MGDTSQIDQVPDDELLSRVRMNSPGNASREAAKTELELRHTKRLIESSKRLADFSARAEKSGKRVEYATWVILFATLAQVGLIVLPVARGRHQSAQQNQGSQEAQPNAVSLELQEKCSKGAQEAFKRDGFENQQLASFSNHYNEKLNKCFVQYDSTDAKTSSGTIFVNKVVSDAFEGKVYAQYMWHSDKVKKYWEVAPVQCTVTLPSAEEKTCTSSEEFDTLVKQYME
jgi:hypothetical protein